ncbi:C-type lectin lectoxin-Thr1-like [Elgaria multicarinata webbii]|uniref:C-type lectin lectoxin-Thr1-like n=1 Tax=Elgaria multicarinata webbii TaxID=159646 RepID=UPI002FCD4005
MGPTSFITLSFLVYLAASPFLEATEVLKGYACPEFWDFFEDNCYRYFSEKKAWKEAEDVCQSLGTHLVSIQSKQESCHLRKYLTKFLPNGDVWIGLHNPQKTPGSAFWQWTDSLALKHSAWNPGQPNNYANTGEFCAELWKSTDFKKWNDEMCNRKNSFVCKATVESIQEEFACK